MTLRLYTLSGSPFGWKVHLAIAFKGLPCAVAYLSSHRGDLDAPWFRALNPHGKVPVLIDGAFALFESDAIVDYLEDAFPSGPSLWPKEPKRRALARRVAIEASAYLYPPVRMLVTCWGEPDAARGAVEEAKRQIARLLEAAAAQLNIEPYFSGEKPGAADFAVYPLVALLRRLDFRRPEEDLAKLAPEPIYAWSREIEALPDFDSTTPPHWRS